MTQEPALHDEEVERVLGGHPTDVRRLGHSRLGKTQGVWRVTSESGSAILKVVGPRRDPVEDDATPDSSFRYWRREPAVLAHGLPTAYVDAGIRGPRLLARFERADDAVSMWLEDVGGRPGSSWALDDFERFARRLGRAQAAWLGDGVFGEPGFPSSRNFLRDYLAEHERLEDWSLLDRPSAWDRPLASVAFSAETRAGLLRLRGEQAAFVDWVGSAPRTLCHLDVWPNNLFAQPGSDVLIDWAFAGVGAVGEDAGNLILDSVLDLLHPAATLGDLDRAVFRGYLDGMREGGWPGDERHVRLAVCASAVKYVWLAPAMLARAEQAEEASGQSSGQQALYGGTQADTVHVFAERGRALTYVVAMAEEARVIARGLGLG